MYAYLKGIPVKRGTSQLILEVNGVGFCVAVPSRLLETIDFTQNSLALHVSYVVREFSHSLYGFICEKDKEFFELLIEISGVGSKLALNILDCFDASSLCSVIWNKDAQALCRVPGIGKRTAERLLMELSGKSLPQAAGESNSAGNSQVQDAIRTLINLGYGNAVAQRAIQTLLNGDPKASQLGLSELITQALQIIK